jgi:hypothetical protein
MIGSFGRAAARLLVFQHSGAETIETGSGMSSSGG